MTKKWSEAWIWVGIVAVAVVIGFGCSSSDSDGAGSSGGQSETVLIGTWTAAMGADDPGDPDMILVLMINADHTYSTTEDGVPEDDGTWSTDGNQVNFSGLEADTPPTFAVSGDTLTLTFEPDEDDDEDEDNQIVFTRV